MARKPKKVRQKSAHRPASHEYEETTASEAVTIAWTVSVTSVFVADLIVIAAHLYARSDPSAKAARVLEAVMLISAAAMGAISLALLVTAWRTRRQATSSSPPLWPWRRSSRSSDGYGNKTSYNSMKSRTARRSGPEGVALRLVRLLVD
jgi:hypothetical protein